MHCASTSHSEVQRRDNRRADSRNRCSMHDRMCVATFATRTCECMNGAGVTIVTVGLCNSKRSAKGPDTDASGGTGGCQVHHGQEGSEAFDRCQADDEEVDSRRGPQQSARPRRQPPSARPRRHREADRQEGHQEVGRQAHCQEGHAGRRPRRHPRSGPPRRPPGRPPRRHPRSGPPRRRPRRRPSAHPPSGPPRRPPGRPPRRHPRSGPPRRRPRRPPSAHPPSGPPRRPPGRPPRPASGLPRRRPSGRRASADRRSTSKAPTAEVGALDVDGALSVFGVVVPRSGRCPTPRSADVRCSSAAAASA